MDVAREVASATLGLRKAQGLRVRQPLSVVTVVSPDPIGLESFTGLLAEEVNVKEVRLVGLDDAAGSAVGVTQRLTVNARAAGPRLGKGVQQVIQAAKSGDWQVGEDGVPVCGGIPLAEGEYTLETVVADDAGHAAVAVLPGGGFVVLDTEVTPQLEAEGWARDVVRQIQDERKAAGLHVSDRISVSLSVPASRLDTVGAFTELLQRETLADRLDVATTMDDSVAVTLTRA
jgi:isoleucyl-tRNA synthetase